MQWCHALGSPENTGKELFVLMFANNSNVFWMKTIMISTLQYWCLAGETSHIIHQYLPATCSKCSTSTYLQCTEMRICMIYIMFVLYMCNEHLDVILAFYLVISFCSKGYSQFTIKMTREFSMNIIKPLTIDYELLISKDIFKHWLEHYLINKI